MRAIMRAGSLQDTRQARPGDLKPNEIELWEALRRQSPSLEAPFFASTFMQSLVAAGADVWVARLTDDDGKRIGFFPYQLRGRGEGVMAGDDMSNRFGALLPADRTLSKEDLLATAGLSSFAFAHMPDDAPTLRLPASDLARSTGLRIDLGSGPESYFESLRKSSGSFLKNVKKRELKLVEEAGPLRFEWSSRDPEGDIARLIEVKRQQYADTGVFDALREEWRRKLLYILARKNDEGCRAIVSTLWAGSRWVASSLNLKGPASLHGWFPAYNRAMTAFGPGHLIRFHILNRMADEGIRTFDFGEGLNQHKREYVTEEYGLFRGFVHATSLRGHMHNLKRAIVWRLKVRKGHIGESPVPETR
jgi:CelD/BcsL family acetyltransferase involved in cellulose biosynthesis